MSPFYVFTSTSPAMIFGIIYIYLFSTGVNHSNLTQLYFAPPTLNGSEI